MKKFYILAIVFFFALLSYGHQNNSSLKIKQAIKSGEWADPTIWDNGSIPLPGDNIMIPSNCEITIFDVVDFSSTSSPNVIYIHGKLIFDFSGRLKLPEGSMIKIESDGSIENTSSSGAMDRVRIGNSIYYTANDSFLKGPYIIKKSESLLSNITLSVALESKKVLVQWVTTKQLPNIKFQLQRNIVGDKWDSIGTVASMINRKDVNTYSYADKDYSNIIANYRLKIIDETGSYVYSPVKSIRHHDFGATLSIGACTKGNIVVHFTQQLNSAMIFNLENLSGKVLRHKKIRDPFGDVTIKLKNIPPGNYMATITGPMGFRYMQPIKL